jgi:hypothetical protein
MINIVDINSQDILNVRDYGKCTVISVDHNGNKNPFKRTAILVKTKNNKQVWIVPERVINKENEHDSNSSNVINGEASLWSAKFDNLGESKKFTKKIQLTESNLKKIIREEAKKILKEQINTIHEEFIFSFNDNGEKDKIYKDFKILCQNLAKKYKLEYTVGHH